MPHLQLRQANVAKIIDDIAMYDASSAAGHPVPVGTAPVMLARNDLPELGPLIARGLSHPGDAERVRTLVEESGFVARTRSIAQHHADTALNALQRIPASEARSGLAALTQRVMVHDW